MYDCAEKNLVANILQQAIADLWLHPHNVDSSLAFFLNEERCYGSFLWCCEILNVAPGAILRQVRNRLDECIQIVESRPKTRRKKVKIANLLDLVMRPKCAECKPEKEGS